MRHPKALNDACTAVRIANRLCATLAYSPGTETGAALVLMGTFTYAQAVLNSAALKHHWHGLQPCICHISHARELLHHDSISQSALSIIKPESM